MITQRLARVILQELNLDNIELSAEMAAADVPGWDSLSHVRILAAIEKEYAIRIKTLEVLRLKNIGDLQILIDRKTAGGSAT